MKFRVMLTLLCRIDFLCSELSRGDRRLRNPRAARLPAGRAAFPGEEKERRDAEEARERLACETRSRDSLAPRADREEGLQRHRAPEVQLHRPEDGAEAAP